MSIDHSDRDDLLNRLTADFADRYRRGERPRPEEYIGRHPELADELYVALSGYATVHQVGGAPRHREVPIPRLSQVGDYRIIRQVGRGGMGIVYEAEQLSLGRRVALKVLPLEGARDHITVERFRRESRASARLHHTNIVPIFEVGQDGELRYFAMQFIEGQSLSAVIDDLCRLRGLSRFSRRPGSEATLPAGHRDGQEVGGVVKPSASGGVVPGGAPETSEPTTPWIPVETARTVSRAEARHETMALLPGGASLSEAGASAASLHRGVAQIGHQVASALAYAHARGIVHRDIKPSNVLLDPEGVAWITDFGLARLDDDSDLTRTGDLVGTLRYLAPERLQGRGDASSDIYGLGLTLYELLTLRAAFDSVDRAALVEQIRAAEPVHPRKVDPRIPRDLETIVLKSIEKEPRRRYPTAGAMAEDLRRYLAGEPILARRVTAPERYLRWARRNPLIAVLGGLLTALLIFVTAGSLLAAQWFREQAEVQRSLAESRESDRRQADKARRIADEANARLRSADEERVRTVYATRSNLALAAWETNDIGQLRSLIDLMKPGPGESDLRGWEWQYLWQLGHEARLSLSASPNARVIRVAFSPDGQALAGMDLDGRIYLWDRPSGALRLKTEPVSPGEPPDLSRGVSDLAFSPDGKRLAGPGPNRTVALYDVESGSIVSRVDGRQDAVLDLAWSPDGRLLVSAISRHVMRVWDVREGRLLHNRFGGHGGPVASIAFSPDGQTLASASFDRTVKLWSLDERTRPRAVLQGHTDEVRAVAFGPTGTRLASAGLDGTIRVWDGRTGAPISVIRGHSGPVSSLAYFPDGRRIASGSFDQTVRLWDSETGEELRSFRCEGAVESLSVSGDGNEVASTGLGAVQVWAANSPPRPRTIRSPSVLTYGGSVESLAFSPDGRRMASAHEDWVVRVWNRAFGEAPLMLRGHTDSAVCVAFSPDSRFLASGGADGSVRVWDPISGRLLKTFDASRETIRTLIFGPDSRTLFWGGDGPMIVARDVESGAERFSLSGHTDRIAQLALSPDRRTLASVSYDGTGRLWDLETGRTRCNLLGHEGAVMGVAFSPDGAVVATCGLDRSLRLWDAETGDPRAILSGHLDSVNCVTFSPDGRLASAGTDRTIRIWDTGSRQAVLILKAHSGSVISLRFSPDGRTLGSSSRDRTIRLWEAGPPDVLPEDR